MKILILVHAQYITVGLQKIIEFAESLVELGHDVTLCTTSKTSRWHISQHKTNGVNIIEFPSILIGRLRHGIDPLDVVRRIMFLRNRKFDVIQCMTSRPTVYFPGIYLKKKHKAILIYEWEDSFGDGGVALERGGRLYNYLFGWIEKYFEESILKYADGVIVVSEFLKQRALKLGTKSEKILKQVKGTKFSKSYLPDKLAAREEIIPKADNDKTIFTYIGSIYDSDLILLFKTFSRVCKIHRNIRLHLVGFNRRAPKNLPKEVSIIPRIPYEEYLKYVAATDVFLLPLKCSVANISRYPSKFGDYLAAGKPVISTPIPEIEYIIKRANCGYTSVDDSIEAYREAFLRAMDDREGWDLMGDNGTKYVQKYLSYNYISDRIISFYKQIALKRKFLELQFSKNYPDEQLPRDEP